MIFLTYIFHSLQPLFVTIPNPDGTAVDPKSGLVETCHVYVEGDTRYMTVLNHVDIANDKNSYYTLQVLEANNKSHYYLFSSWGRIGTTIGDKKVECCHDQFTAVYEFERLYKRQTGNKFGTKDFKKKPGKYYPIDVDFGSDNVHQQRSESFVPSVLPQPIHNLMKTLFDLNEMKKVMLEYNLDMDKMPLGKLSKAQIMKALTVLTQMSELIKNGASRAKFIGACNHFYTLIPHSFGERSPPVINTVDEINKKAQMLQNLIELEVAYALLNNEGAADKERNPFDCHYEQLRTELLVLDPESDEYEYLERYMLQTHAGTHNNYVKGLGKTYPNPECSAFTEDDVEVPLGIPITDLSIESGLLYNEYIVYDEAQVNIKYLFNLKFTYKY